MTTTPRHLQRTVLSLLAAGGLVAGGVLSAAPSGMTVELSRIGKVVGVRRT